MTNLTYLVDEENTNSFIEGSYYGNLGKNYLYLYILSLHQRYALIHMTMQVSELPNRLTDYISHRNDKDSYKELTSLMGKMTFFTLRCSYKQVSNITHQAKLYDIIRSSLKIEDLMNELHFEFESLSSIISLKNSEEQSKQLELEKASRALEEERAKVEGKRTKIKEDPSQSFSTFIAVISIFFVTISTLGDGWAVLEKLSKKYVFINKNIHLFDAGIQIIIFALFIISIVVYYILSKRKKQKLKELEQTKRTKAT